MKRTFRVEIALLTLTSGLGVGLLSSPAFTASNNPLHKLNAYDLTYYGSFWDNKTKANAAWKGTVTPVYEWQKTPNFYLEMKCGTSTYTQCANTSSSLSAGSAITPKVLTEPNAGLQKADLAYLYGHALVIRQYNWIAHTGYTAWQPYNNGVYALTVSGSWARRTITDTGASPTIYDFGTSTMPFYFHYRGSGVAEMGIRDSNYISPAYAMFYSYNPLTSVLFGEDYRTGTWKVRETINTQTGTSRTGQLGPGTASNKIKFLVAPGCQLVPAARYVNHVPPNVELSDQAHQLWKRSWRGMHVVVGHYYSSTTGILPDAVYFADNLINGYGVIESWFLAHYNVPTYPNDPAEGQPSGLAPRYQVTNPGTGLRAGTYNGDRWITPQVADPTAEQETWEWSEWYAVGQ